MPALPSMASRVEHDPMLTLTTIFNIFTSLGIFSTVAVLAPALLSSHVKRSRTWFGVLATWLVYSVSYILLIGRQFGPEPPLGLCIFQAGLVYATSPLCAIATTCFAIDFFLKLSRVKVEGKAIGRKAANILIILPWILGFMIIVEAILSVQEVAKVRRDTNHFYCRITSQVPSLTNIAIIFICGLIITPLEIYTAIHLHRNWAVFKRLSRNHAHIALSTFIRLALFSMIVSFAMGISVFTATHIEDATYVEDNGPAFSLVLTTLPTFSALCLGTQRDMLGIWLFWKRREPVPPIPPPKDADMPIITNKYPTPVLNV